MELLDRYRVAGDQNPEITHQDDSNDKQEAARLEEERKGSSAAARRRALKQELQAMKETYREGLKMLSTLEAMLVTIRAWPVYRARWLISSLKKRLERTGIKAQKALEEKIRRMEGERNFLSFYETGKIGMSCWAKRSSCLATIVILPTAKRNVMTLLYWCFTGVVMMTYWCRTDVVLGRSEVPHRGYDGYIRMSCWAIAKQCTNLILNPSHKAQGKYHQLF